MLSDRFEYHQLHLFPNHWALIAVKRQLSPNRVWPDFDVDMEELYPLCDTSPASDGDLSLISPATTPESISPDLEGEAEFFHSAGVILATSASWFSTLDLASGYWQVSLSPEARCKTAFATHSGLFQFKVMPFGLCNAPATFERLMDQVLQGLRWSRCLVYLDDIISFGTTFEDALDNFTLIFERLRTYALQLKSTKCHLFQTSVPFLGHVVGRRGLECDPKKIEDVKSWPIPDCKKSVRQFLGFVGYYRRFIPSFADLAEPLVAFTGKDVPFVWRPGCATAFTNLRDVLVRAPIFLQKLEPISWILWIGRGPQSGPRWCGVCHRIL